MRGLFSGTLPDTLHLPYGNSEQEVSQRVRQEQQEPEGQLDQKTGCGRLKSFQFEKC